MFCSNCGLNLQKAKQDQKSDQPSFPQYVDPDKLEKQPDNPRYMRKEQISHGTNHGSPKYDGPSNILESVDELGQVPNRPRSIPFTYYLLSFIFWPIGIFFWAERRSDPTVSANNLLIASILGLSFWIFLVVS